MKSAEDLIKDADEALKKEPLFDARGDFSFAFAKYARAIREKTRTDPFYQNLALTLPDGSIASCNIIVGSYDKIVEKTE